MLSQLGKRDACAPPDLFFQINFQIRADDMHIFERCAAIVLEQIEKFGRDFFIIF